MTWVCKVTGAPQPKPKNWSPEPEGMAEVLTVMAQRPALITWGFCALYTAGRTTAVRLLGPHALSSRRGQTVLELHPPGWPRSSKRNPCLPVAGPILAEMGAWDAEERWCPYAESWLLKQFSWLRKQCGMPLLEPGSFRDYMATALRHAHLDFGTDEVMEEFVERWMGHRDVPTTDQEEARTVHRRYGLYRPDYLRTPRLAVEAVMLDLDRRSGGALFRLTNPHAFRQNSAEHASREVAEQAFAEGKPALRGRACDLQGPDITHEFTREPMELDALFRGETVEIGGIRGQFRQTSAKPAARLDEAFEPQLSTILRLGPDRFQFVPEDGHAIARAVVNRGARR